MFRTRAIRQKVSLKVFSMETPCWRPSGGLHGGRKPVETSGVKFASLKKFILYLSAKLENIRIGTSVNILVTQNSKT